jgi:serine protease Do
MQLKKEEYNLTEIYLDYFKKHQNVIYFALGILFVLQIILLAVITFQNNKISTLIDDNKQFKENLGNLSYALDVQFLEVNQTLWDYRSIQKQVVKDLEILKLSKDFTSIAQRAIKSVVSINSFNSEYSDGSLGTGFFITSNGYLVTNYHVIESMNFVDIINNQKSTLRARVIGHDSFKDVALLKVDFNSTPLEFADSSQLQIGQKVVAIGNPLGLEFSLTEGIISGLRRLGTNNLQNYIQTDVAINPGNSGGPLINGDGLVIGINTFKYVDQTVEGMGFALESNELKNTINQIAGFKLLN